MNFTLGQSMRTAFWAAFGICGTISADPVPNYSCSYCLGPENYGVNAPMRPKTCNGQWISAATGLYWNAHQDGLEFAIKTGSPIPIVNPFPSEIQEINHLSGARYEIPHYKWQFGFKLSLGYDLPCDGWDIGITWTDYKTRSKNHIETEPTYDTIIPLWSAFAPAQGTPLYARDAQATWKVKLTLLDLDLGREYWTSKRLSLHPHIGLRFARAAQDLDLEHKGGSWSPRTNPNQPAFNNIVNLDNNFKGLGLRSGLDAVWHYECGFGLFGNLAASLIYGPFKIAHKENNRPNVSPYHLIEILSTSDRFKASRAILDCALGVQWTRQFCDCAYRLKTRFGWEGHLFFNQNQLWRVRRYTSFQGITPNNTGQNIFYQSRGTLDTQGWSVSFLFEF